MPQITERICRNVAGEENDPSPSPAEDENFLLQGGKKMKRFWLVLLSLGLIMAFSTSALAVEVKVAGDFYVGGLYLNKTALTNYYFTNPLVPPYKTFGERNPASTSFFYQRLRVGTDFIVSPCLKLVTRFDAMERIWGGTRANNWQVNNVMPEYSAGTRNESENIAFDSAYIEYVSPIGKFEVGYMPDSTWGTVFANDSIDSNRGMIKWVAPVGPVYLLANYTKITDNSSSAVSTQSWNWRNRLNATRTDRDTNSYRLGFIYPFKSDKVSGQAGALYVYTRDAKNRGMANQHPLLGTPFPYKSEMHNIMPYFKANIGPVALQGELKYSFGDAVKMEYDMVGGLYRNQKIDSLSAFLDAVATFGMINVGGTFAYLQGDKDPLDNKVHDVNDGGKDWNPCLIMFNSELMNYWVGDLDGWYGGIGGPMKNAWFFQGRVGVKPTPQADVVLSVSYAKADKKLSFADAPFIGLNAFAPQKRDYGIEIDLTGTYKITNNLSYMLGAAYLFTGDYFETVHPSPAITATADLEDNFMLINKLTLSF